RGNPVVATSLRWLALIALAAILAGCGGREGGKRTVVFWQFSPLTAIQPVLDKFHHEHPDIQVKVEQLTWQSGREKIVAAVAAGEREVLFKKFMPFAWGNAGDILDSTLTPSVVHSPQNVAALRFYLSLKPFSLLDRHEMLDEAFTRGRIGFALSGPWMLRKL